MKFTRKKSTLLLMMMCLLLVIVAGCGNKPSNNSSNNETANSNSGTNNGTSSGAAGNAAGNEASPAPQETAAAPAEGVPSETASHPVVTIEMDNGGIIKAELYPEVAPNTVNNFISLIQKGFYNGTIFHRVIPGFMIQGGDPDGTGMGGPGYGITGEFSSNGFVNNLLHTEGILSMARSQDANSAGSQFFVMTAVAPHLDGEYAPFGKVTEGLEVVSSIVNLPRDSSDRPDQPPVMKKVTVDTLGVTYPEPQKVQ
ncbi:peptidylprolyl isomerase [Paenibacillus wynnii]|uniref:peptidylprolyl isomerase n=1 Tax=Paenibacillus wynnii TaxID=268407 RepID=UPI00278FD8C8|nr:peptidylprolyl isomerase [Paenibacillus wynnii]MDQ0193937.1 peptidyl-prolyl cis-trans isomerase B (cyclophilin B) [Paenibacillus wynnii]